MDQSLFDYKLSLYISQQQRNYGGLTNSYDMSSPKSNYLRFYESFFIDLSTGRKFSECC